MSIRRVRMAGLRGAGRLALISAGYRVPCEDGEDGEDKSHLRVCARVREGMDGEALISENENVLPKFQHLSSPSSPSSQSTKKIHSSHWVMVTVFMPLILTLKNLSSPSSHKTIEQN